MRRKTFRQHNCSRAACTVDNPTAKHVRLTAEFLRHRVAYVRRHKTTPDGGTDGRLAIVMLMFGDPYGRGTQQKSPNSISLVTSCLDTTRHVRRVERVERVETSVSSRARPTWRTTKKQYARVPKFSLLCSGQSREQLL